jgi:subtilisin family serine protease
MMKTYLFKFVAWVLLVCLFLVPSYTYGFSDKNTTPATSKYQNFSFESRPFFSSSKLVRVIVKCKQPSIVEKNSRNQGLPISSSSIIHGEKSYKEWLQSKQQEILDTLPLNDRIQVLGQWQIVYNGFALSLPEYALPYLAKNPSVITIYRDNKLFYPLRDVTIDTILRNDVPLLEHYNKVIVEPNPDIRIGIVDSGIDYNHPDFYPPGFAQDSSKIAGGWDCYYPEEDQGKEKPGDPDPIDDSTFTGGHGTHVAGIAGGNNPSSLSLHGICPDATLYAYKVFPSNKSGGAPSYTLITACEYAVQDQCSVINLSLGHPGENPSIVEDNPYFEAFQMTKASGVMIVAAAGNGGSRTEYNQWPIDAPGVFDSALQVAASDDRLMQPFTIHTPISQRTFLGQNSRFSPPFTSELDGLDIVYCGFGSEEECNQSDLNGKIALIQRGPKDKGITFFEKNINAKEAGALACIIFNYDERSFSPSLTLEGIADPYKHNFIPCMMVSATLQKQLQDVVDGIGYVSYQETQSMIASYTSAGPCFSVDDGFFKPEITAPGTSIYSSIPTLDTKETPPQWGKKQGTSMATPVISGCAAILRHIYPFLSIDEITALMMNTSTLLQNPLTGSFFSFFYQGSGQVNLEAAITSPLLATPHSIMVGSEELENPIEIQLKNVSDHFVSGTLTTEILSNHNYAESYIGVFDKPFVTLSPHSTETVKCWLYPTETELPLAVEGVVWIRIMPSEDMPNLDLSLHIPFVVSSKSTTIIQPPISDVSLSLKTLHMDKENFGFLSFQLNSGTITRSTYIKEDGSVLRSVDRVRNYADQVFLTIHDEYGNMIDSIFYGDSVPVGRYDYFWDGYDPYRQPFLPNGRYYFTVTMPSIEEIYVTTIQENKKETHRKIQELNTFIKSESISFEVLESSLPPFPILEFCTPQKVRDGEVFEVEIKVHNVYEGLLDITIGLDSSLQIVQVSDKEEVSIEVQKSTNLIRLLHKQAASSDKVVSYVQLLLRCSSPDDKDYVPSFDVEGIIPYAYRIEKPKKMIHETIVSKDDFLLGDFNKNNQIDEEDILLLEQNFGNTIHDTSWNPLFDCFQDGVINIKDLFLLAKQRDI